MPLTPEDVSNKRFTAVRLREGYDMGEVDQFLDEVEAELTRLVAENDELRAKVDALQDGRPVPEKPAAAAAPEAEDEPAEEPTEDKPAEEPTPEPEPEREPEREPESAAPAAAESREPETIQVTTTAEASKAATRLLELAGQNADQLVAEAREQAEQILAGAREQAEQLESETTERRQHLFGDLESERAEVEAEVERLKEFQRGYRAELKGYFEQQLRALEGGGEPGSLSGQQAGSSDADASGAASNRA